METQLGAPRKMRRRKAEDGFSLVELMVVIVILGLLATVVALNVLPSQDKAMVEKAKADLATLENAVEMFRLDVMTYPTTEQGLDALTSAPGDLRRAERYRPGGYVKRLPDDPWGNPYQYLSPEDNGGTFSLYSLGADGQIGGEGLNADISAGS